jgi:hypothetical protein
MLVDEIVQDDCAAVEKLIEKRRAEGAAER